MLLAVLLTAFLLEVSATPYCQQNVFNPIYFLISGVFWLTCVMLRLLWRQHSAHAYPYDTTDRHTACHQNNPDIIDFAWIELTLLVAAARRDCFYKIGIACIDEFTTSNVV